MAEFIVVGVSHHTAPLAKREKMAVAADQLASESQFLREEVGVSESVILSTCNRVEYYCVVEDPRQATAEIMGRMLRRAGAEDTALLYRHLGSRAVKHLFRVGASLDSMVVGEPQILGQVKEAFRLAEQSGYVGTLSGRCFTRAFNVAKRVRSDTRIAAGSVSVSSVASELAQRIFGRLEGRKVLLIGAGEMGEASARSFGQAGTLLRVLNRSPERADALAAACGGESRPWETLVEELGSADVAITSTGSRDYIITQDLMKPVIKARRQRPLFLIDISVPRNVDPQVGKMRNVFLYDVDDMQQVAAVNLAARKGACEEAEQLIEQEVDAFAAWRRSLTVKPTIVALRQRVKALVAAEVTRSRAQLGVLGAKEEKALEMMTDAIVKKLVHEPIQQLKSAAESDNDGGVVEAVQALFGLELAEENTPSPSESSDAEVVELETTPGKERESA